MSRRSSLGGYTLLEVVVALAILSISMAALSESYSLSLRRSLRAENLMHASLMLGSVRDRLGVDIPLDGRPHSDQAEGCSWRVESTLVARDDREQDIEPHAYQAHLEVQCGEGTAARSAAIDLFALSGAWS
jgi:prepilin-type N-terminal cleavage/methylation domain-containing protein